MTHPIPEDEDEAPPSFTAAVSSSRVESKALPDKVHEPGQNGVSEDEWKATERAAEKAIVPSRAMAPPRAQTPRHGPKAHREALPARTMTGERVAPHNIDAEQGLLASCLLENGGDIVSMCQKESLQPAAFYRPQHQIIWEAMLALVKEGKPTDEIVLANALKAANRLDAIGGHAYLYEITNRIQTTVHAKHWLQIVKEKYLLRCYIRKCQWAIEQAHGAGEGSLPEFAASIKTEFDHIEREIHTDPGPPKSLMDFELQEHNPNRLLGDDYIERGDAFTVISETSAGKSSFIIQFSACLALGRAFFGIQTSGKHRSLIIQAEDSDSYNAKVKESIIQGLDLTLVEQAEVKEMVVIKRIRGISGAAFYAKVRALAEAHKADFVWINPIGRFITGSLAKDEVAAELFVQLDASNPNSQWAYGIVEHTGKPAKDDGGTDNNKALRSAYKGFGSSVLANSPRAIMVLEQRLDVLEGREFYLDLPKNGLRAGVTERVEQGAGAVYKPVTRVAIKHTDRKIKTPWGKELPMYLWEVSGAPRTEPINRPYSAAKSREDEYEKLKSLMPVLPSTAKRPGELERHIESTARYTHAKVQRLLRRLEDEGRLLKTEDGREYMKV